MASIRDVAQKAGVAIATVSAALNESAPVRASTRARVLAAAQELGYQPNGVARSLRKGHTRLIALVVSDITNPFFGALARAVESVAMAHDFAVIVGDTDEDPERESQILTLLGVQRVAGVLLAPCGVGADYIAALKALAPTPLVVVDREAVGLARDYVGLDSWAAGRMVTEYLIRLGHQRIGFVGGTEGLANADARRAGYEAALRDQGLAPEPSLICSAGFRAEQAYQAVQPLLTRADRPSALIAANNVMALGCMQALRDLHFRCPEVISLAGIDDMPWSTALSPPLTVVSQPIEALAREACEQLLQRIAGLTHAATPPRRTLFPPTLVVRDSCAAVAEAGAGRGAAPALRKQARGLRA